MSPLFFSANSGQYLDTGALYSRRPLTNTANVVAIENALQGKKFH
jgi:hypothetical protein